MSRRGRLAPLLWLTAAALAALLPWAWRQRHAPSPPPERPLPPLTLTGDTRRDCQAILERAALRLRPVHRGAFPDEAPLERAALMGEIGAALLPLDLAVGKAVVQQSVEMATVPADRVTREDLDAPEHTRIGMLVRLAHAVRTRPELADRALQMAFEEARGVRDPISQGYALSLFAREAADIDPTRARAAVRQAQGALFSVPLTAAADPFAAAAAAVARVDGPDAARPLVRRALAAIPNSPARALVEARLAARLAAAAPAQARTLAQHARADAGGRADRRSGVQLHDVAVILAVTHPQVASAAVERLPDPAARAAALTEMGGAVESHYPARAETLFRLALQQARAVPSPQARTAAVIGAATGLAAYDFRAARAAVTVLPAPLPRDVVIILAVRASKREPEAALQFIEKMPNGDPSTVGHNEGRDAIALARVSAEPDLRHALAMAQQSPNPDLQAGALLSVARRLNTTGSHLPHNY